MELHELKPAAGSNKKNKRIGRGQGSGRGGTSTRGHKGQKSRSGYSRKRNFEGGQMPLQMRVPKRGFKSPNREEYTIFNLSRLNDIAEKLNVTDIDVSTLVKNGYAKKTDRIKILGSGTLDKNLNVTAHAFSQSAKEAIEGKGGKATESA